MVPAGTEDFDLEAEWELELDRIRAEDGLGAEDDNAPDAGSSTGFLLTEVLTAASAQRNYEGMFPPPVQLLGGICTCACASSF